MKLDRKHWKILEILQRHARSSNTEIASAVNLSLPAVAERIKKLEDTGVISGYTARIAPFDVGYQLSALITLRAFVGRLKPFLLAVSGFKEVLNCYRVTGNENIVMHVVLRDQKHLEAFIDVLITYGECKTQIILSEVVKDRPITSGFSR